jgi:hypothetical protein
MRTCTHTHTHTDTHTQTHTHLRTHLCINQGLKLFPALVIVPTLQIGWTLFSIVSGLLYFQEYRGMGGLQAGMFAAGVGVRLHKRATPSSATHST